MLDFNNDHFLRLACQTTLPTSRTASRTADNATVARPYTRAQAKVQQQTQGLSVPSLEPSSPSKKRARKSEFEIFIDVNSENTTPAPSPKKSKPNGRVPLAVRTISASTIPTPAPRGPGQPFPFSPSDPLWEDIENYEARVGYMSPPSTPGRDSPVPGQAPHTPGGFSPAPPTSRYHTPRASTPTAQPRHTSTTRPLPAPVNMALYDVLELNTWRATEEEIKAAYKMIAKGNHPDKVAVDKREDATQFMQTMNAAKEVLLDSKRRRKYHKTGKLPWTT